MTRNFVRLHHAVEFVSQIPCLFDSLRWFLEAGFINHRRLISESFRTPPPRVLDCGCGTGVFARCFAPDSYHGVDISSRYVERARRCNPQYRFDVMDATSLQFSDSSFDAVIVSGVIHHLPHEQSLQMLAEISRVLRSEGTLLLWEDVPTRSPFNLVGRLVHSLDVGDFIRDQAGYETLLVPNFEISNKTEMQSGFMDYVAFRAIKLSTMPKPATQPAIVHPIYVEFPSQRNGVSELGTLS